MKKSSLDLVAECSDINETVIAALEKGNTIEGCQAVTVLKLLRGKLYEIEKSLTGRNDES